MTDYVIVGLEYQRQFAWEPVCHPGMDDCVDTWVGRVCCTSPTLITKAVSSDREKLGE